MNLFYLVKVQRQLCILNSKIHFNLVDGKWLENFLCEVFTEKNENFDLLERDFSLCLTAASCTRKDFYTPLKMATDFCTASQKQATPPSHAPKPHPDGYCAPKKYVKKQAQKMCQKAGPKRTKKQAQKMGQKASPYYQGFWHIFSVFCELISWKVHKFDLLLS